MNASVNGTVGNIPAIGYTLALIESIHIMDTGSAQTFLSLYWLSEGNDDIMGKIEMSINNSVALICDST